MPYSFSPSSLSLLKECQRCFWLKFKKGIKRPKSVFPSLPSGIDNVLKKHFDFFKDKKTLPPELSALKEKAKLFDNAELLNEWRNSRRGIKWKDQDGNTLKGAIDNLLESQGKLIVLDYKTRGFPLRRGIEIYYQDQINIYNFLLRKNNFETENYSYLLFYHPKKVSETGEIIFHTDLVKIHVSIKNAVNLFESALKVLAQECPKNNNCDWCKNIKL